MVQSHDYTNLKEHWDVFLKRNLDAQVIVHRVMDRTGFSEGEVLFYFMSMWAEQNLTSEQRRGFDKWVDESMSIS